MNLCSAAEVLAGAEPPALHGSATISHQISRLPPATAGDGIEFPRAVCLTGSVGLELLWATLRRNVWKLRNSKICFKNASSPLCNKVRTVQKKKRDECSKSVCLKQFPSD